MSLDPLLTAMRERKHTFVGRFETSQKQVTLSSDFAVETEDCQSVRSATHAFAASSGNNPRWLSRLPESRLVVPAALGRDHPVLDDWPHRWC